MQGCGTLSFETSALHSSYPSVSLTPYSVFYLTGAVVLFCAKLLPLDSVSLPGLFASTSVPKSACKGVIFPHRLCVFQD